MHNFTKNNFWVNVDEAMVMLNVDGDNEDQEDFDKAIQSKKEDAFEFMTVGNMEQF